MRGLLILTILVTSSSALTRFYDSCGIDKGCFGTPNNCIENGNCQIAFSYRKVSEELLEFQLISDDIHGDEYIAVGLSQDQLMRNDAVIACTSTYR